MENNILDFLWKSAKKYPEKVAFCDSEGNKITFLELADQVKKIGSYIIENYKNEKKGVVVLTDRNIKSIPVFLGVVYSGNFYIPVDCSLPDERLKTMFDLASPFLIIDCGEKLHENISNKILFFDDLNPLSIKDQKKNISIDALYGIFTSGSTGNPKLILKNHISLINFINSYTELFGFKNSDVQGNQIPFYFDASTKDLFTTLKVACTTNIIGKNYFSQPGRLAQYLIDNKINSICWVPSAMAMLSMFGVFNKINLTQLTRVLFVGEAMQSKQLKIWKNALPNTKFINLYGSTENAGNCLYYEVKDEIEENKRIPIGKEFPNCKVFLLDDEDKIINKNDILSRGEICISGDILSLGYYKDFPASASKFCQNPANNEYYERIYKTGDVGQYDENGNIVYICRKDYQIKLNGYRIELGDIEVVASSVENIDGVCCLFDEIKKRIVLYYGAKKDVLDNLKKNLKEKLPFYMLPTKYICLESLPINRNGKTDRVKIKELYKQYE